MADDSKPTLLERIVLEPAKSATACVIWLHGLGADGHDFVPIVRELGLPTELGVRFVFPHAPAIGVTINGGMVMPAWYDILGMDFERREDEAGVLLSTRRLEALIADQRAQGIASERIVVAGFSQGGAIALHAGLRHAEPLAGIMALSTYMVLGESLEAQASEANRGVPILQCHGSQDPMVPIGRGQAARERMEALGYAVEWHSYPMQHQVCAEEIDEVGRWLRRVLA
ncbi:alpha/beta hydrolase [Engelhardtia mirabilis]|uniref:Carboxylesterase 2 n=1 Tax=Engelhardtia mirabilis TaxID=2528011 RepID=A0A518BG48_9BACT|nr:Carboxylesterase 2 [Planctomycetes bacterium Pla133]QDV00262.1 Carboxylesterase 2 [Planctomycetes bacterium Pla86]